MSDWLYYGSAIAAGYVAGEVIIRLVLQPLVDRWDRRH